MRRTTDEMIKKSVGEGYVMLEEGYGKQDEVLSKYRNLGYDVRAWYVPSDVEGVKQWVAYGRKKKSAKFVTDYATLTVKALKNLCQEKSISKYYKMNKEQMIEELKKVG